MPPLLQNQAGVSPRGGQQVSRIAGPRPSVEIKTGMFPQTLPAIASAVIDFWRLQF